LTIHLSATPDKLDWIPVVYSILAIRLTKFQPRKATVLLTCVSLKVAFTRDWTAERIPSAARAL